MARRVLRRGCVGVVTLCWVVMAGSCDADGPSSADGKGDRLVVLAASSLTEPFEALGRVYEAEHPGATVAFGFAGSSGLVRQILDGARADVFASADEETMQAAVSAGVAVDPVVVARNRLAILVEKGNPRRIRTLADVAEPGVVLVACAPAVPCGRLAAAAFRAAGVSPTASSFEENVKAVVAKVTLGEADAGIVYRSDVRAARGRADGVDIDLGGGEFEAVYAMAVTAEAAHPAAARRWVALVRSPRGRMMLSDAGFLVP